MNVKVELECVCVCVSERERVRDRSSDNLKLICIVAQGNRVARSGKIQKAIFGHNQLQKSQIFKIKKRTNTFSK